MKSIGQKKSAADKVLAGMAAAFVCSVPFIGTVPGSCLFHTAMAGLAGGCADWYAVTALFRRPLGIRFQTAVIPAGRDRIIRMACDMVENELLTVPHINAAIREHPPVQAVLDYTEENREETDAFIRLITGEIVGRIREAERQSGRDAAERMCTAVDLPKMLAQIIRYPLREGNGQLLFPCISDVLRDILKQEKTACCLEALYRNAWDAYEGKSTGRGMLRGLMESQLGLTAEKIGHILQEKLIGAAEQIPDPESRSGRFVRNMLDHMAELLEHDEDVRAKINQWKDERLIPELRKSSAVPLFIKKLLETEEKQENIVRYLTKTAWKTIHAFSEDEGRKYMANRFLLKQFAAAAEYLRPLFGHAAERELSKYSGKEMAEMIESKVYGDLQMIRINGSVIGMFLGFLSYILFCAAQGGAV